MPTVMDRKSESKNGSNGHAGSTNTNNNSRVKLLDLSHITPEKGVARAIDRALELRSSDIFFVTNEQHVAVLVRLRGQMEQLCILDSDQGRRYIAHIRNMAGMDVSDHRRPHDGRWIYDVDDHTRFSKV